MTNKMVFKAAGLCLLGVGAFALAGCKERPKAAVPVGPDVEVVKVAQRDVPITMEWVGSLDGDVNASISAQVGGYLISRNYNEGSTVTNGQVLFQIDPAPFQAVLALARAQRAQALADKGKTKLDVERYRPLAKTDAISQQELDNAVQADLAADAQVEAADAAVKQAELNLAFTTIRSPIDGVVGLAKGQVGDLVGPSSGALTSVSKINPMRVYFSLAEQVVYRVLQRIDEERGSVKTASPVLEIVLASGEVYPEKGKIRFADNQVDVKTGTIRMVGEFPNPKETLLPGMFARVRATVGVARNALLLPQRAVMDMQGNYLVAVVDEANRAHIRPVKAGMRSGSDWVIEAGVKAGERVVAEGVQKVRDGMPVNPQPFKTPPAPAFAPGSKTP